MKYFTRILTVLAVVVVVVSLGACATVNAPVSATSNPVGSKVGEASGQIYLSMFGDAQIGIREAAANGGITEISTVDFEIKQFLGLITTFTTTVTGE